MSNKCSALLHSLVGIFRCVVFYFSLQNRPVLRAYSHQCARAKLTITPLYGRYSFCSSVIQADFLPNTCFDSRFLKDQYLGHSHRCRCENIVITHLPLPEKSQRPALLIVEIVYGTRRQGTLARTVRDSICLAKSSGNHQVGLSFRMLKSFSAWSR